MSTLNRIQDVKSDLQQNKLYRIAVSETTDIEQIADMSNMSYEETLKYLEEIIKMAARSKKWYAFKGADTIPNSGIIIIPMGTVSGFNKYKRNKATFPATLKISRIPIIQFNAVGIIAVTSSSGAIASIIFFSS